MCNTHMGTGHTYIHTRYICLGLLDHPCRHSSLQKHASSVGMGRQVDVKLIALVQQCMD